MSAANPLYFFSYSRQELYFAESAVVALQKAGVNIWFDLQQLEPGSIWGDEIQRGLKYCEGMILLASRASLSSPWVKMEWEHALEMGKPVYIMLFEAVSFDPIPASEENGFQAFALDNLRDNAAAIIDMRRNFRKNIRRLAKTVHEQLRTQDPIPTPNRWSLPTRMPISIAFAAASLFLVTALMIWVSLWGFSIYLPMMVGGLMIAAWLGDRAFAFLQRRSYREARIILPVAAALSVVILPFATPILGLASVLVYISPSVVRWSPLGQGVDWNRHRGHIPHRLTPPRSFLEWMASTYIRSMGRLRWPILFFVGLVTAVILAINLATPGRIIPIEQYIFPFLTILFIVFEILNRRLRRPIPSGMTYTIAAATEDERIIRQIDREMRRAGHESRLPKADSVRHFYILVLSNYTTTPLLEAFAQSTDRVICVVASALDDWARFEPLSCFQFVDYRRQQRRRLSAMAMDMFNIGVNNVRFSFGTRQTPEGFHKLIVPSRVAWFLGVLYFLVYWNTISYIQNFFTSPSQKVATFLLFQLLIYIPVWMWLIVRVTRREISILKFTIISLAVSSLHHIIFVALNYPYYSDALNPSLVFTWVANAFTYLFCHVFLWRWFPSRSPLYRNIFRFRRDFNLWRFHIVAVAVLTLFAFVFLGDQFIYGATPRSDAVQTVTYENQLKLEIPAYWHPSDSIEFQNSLRRIHRFWAALERVSAIDSSETITSLSYTMFGEGTWVIDPSSPLDSKTWPLDLVQALNYGYLPEPGNTFRTLRFRLQANPLGFIYTDEPRDLLKRVEDQTSSVVKTLQSLHSTAVTSEITRLEQRFTFRQYLYQNRYDEYLTLGLYVVIFDTPGTDFLLSFVGDEETLQAENSAIEKLIASLQIEEQIQPEPPVEIELDALRFQIPAHWDEATIKKLSTPIIWEQDYDPFYSMWFYQDLQNLYNGADVPFRVIWGGKVSTIQSPVILALARYDELDAPTTAAMDSALDRLSRVMLEKKDSKLLEDETRIIRDDLSLHVIKFNTSRSQIVWIVGLHTADQYYIARIEGGENAINGYSDALNAWLASFHIVP